MNIFVVKISIKTCNFLFYRHIMILKEVNNMGMPNIPDIKPKIELSFEETIN